MPQVETLRGPIDTAELGFSLMHEHVFVLSEGVAQNFPSVWNEEEEIISAREKLAELPEIGVDTIVDLTVWGLGRDFQNRDADAMAGLFVKDITDGIQGTDVKAAILKCATDEPGVTPGVEKVLQAVARAHRRTGVPISTHTHSGTKRGLEQQAIFEQVGVDLSRVVIGHSGDTEDVDYLEELLKRGSYIGMDRFGIDVMLSFEKRVAIVAKMCERGHADRMVLAHDAACYIDWYPAEILRQTVPIWHYRHISEDVLPALRAAGVSDEQIQQMTVENPRRIFEAQGAY